MARVKQAGGAKRPKKAQDDAQLAEAGGSRPARTAKLTEKALELQQRVGKGNKAQKNKAAAKVVRAHERSENR